MLGFLLFGNISTERILGLSGRDENEACEWSRPSIESQTNEDEIEVKTETLSITATPLANGYVKAKTGDDTTDTIYADWYKSVYMPTADVASEAVTRSAAKTTTTKAVKE